jgi:putative ABC transport system permease protein
VGQSRLVFRLAGRDLRRRRGEVVLLLLAIVAATSTLSVGLQLRGSVTDPYDQTREATAGPDVVAVALPLPNEDPDALTGNSADLAGLEELIGATGVAAHSGPFPATGAVMEANGQTIDVQAVGRSSDAALVDQPALTRGDWVRDGAVVVEAAFADALGANVGDRVTLNGRTFDVAGIAVTASSEPYPKVTCVVHCMIGVADAAPAGGGEARIGTPFPGAVRSPGMVWMTTTDATSIVSDADTLSYVLYLQLEDPDAADQFVVAHRPTSMSQPNLISWQDIFEQVSHVVRNTQRILLAGSSFLSLLAVATVAVLVGGRMADQGRRVGLLKAVGGTPRLVAAVLLAEYVFVALVAAGIGLVLGRLTAPLLTEPTAGLVGSSAAPSLTLPTVAIVVAVAVGVAVVATFVPAVRAARTSTALALNDSARPPRRTAWLIALSARLPVPLLLALRTMARRPRRVAVSVAGITIAVAGIVAALAANTQLDTQRNTTDAIANQLEQLSDVMGIVTLMLIVIASVNVIFVTWATVLDSRHASAIARALGATPRQVSTGLAVAQILPAIIGAALGTPAGIGLFVAVFEDTPTLPPPWQLLAVVVVVPLMVAGLTAVPARSGARRPVADTLQVEPA